MSEMEHVMEDENAVKFEYGGTEVEAGPGDLGTFVLSIRPLEDEAATQAVLWDPQVAQLRDTMTAYLETMGHHVPIAPADREEQLRNKARAMLDPIRTSLAALAYEIERGYRTSTVDSVIQAHLLASTVNALAEVSRLAARDS